MTKRNKNTLPGKSRFLHYRKGEMTGSERNAFEKELQKDPFSKEAAEGFELLSPEEMQNDLSLLSKKVQARTNRRQRYVLYRIAASVAVLMIVSSVFIIVERKSRDAATSLTVKEQTPFTIARSEPVRPEPGTIAPKKPEGQAKIKKPAAAADEQVSENPGEPLKNLEKEEEPLQAPDLKVSEEPVRADKRVMSDEAFARMPAGAAGERSLRKAEAVPKISGQVKSTDDSMPLPGVSVTIKGTGEGTVTDSNGNFSLNLPKRETVTLVAASIGMKTVELPATSERPVEIELQPDVAALNEVVVTGYGVRKPGNDEMSAYQPPQPVNGNSAYNKYIEANIHRPDSATAGQRAVVVARFPVLSDGTIGSINILRTAGPEFSQEAIRLIKSGPAWKPATRGGVSVEDSVTLRIVFK